MPYALVTGFTPGPNNILAFDAVSRDGWRKSQPLLVGIASGFFCVMLVCALACFELARLLPTATGVLKYIGAAYLVWLGVCILRDKPSGGAQEGRSSFRTGFFLQFANVKIILYALTVYTGYVLPVSHAPALLLCAAAVNTAAGLAGTFAWACAGGALQRLIRRHRLGCNLAMAAVLLWSAALLLRP